MNNDSRTATAGTANLLPYDGEVYYHGRILPPEKAAHYLEKLLTGIEWKNDEAIIFGRHIITKRKAAWYGDKPFSYTYSGTTKNALPWSSELQELKMLTERFCGHQFNSCLLNLYHNGDEGMAWHSDDEKSLGKDSPIASLSLGAERKFVLRHRQSKEPVSLTLENGSLLLMQGTTQTYWLHALPKTKKVQNPRVNCTFRFMLD